MNPCIKSVILIVSLPTLHSSADVNREAEQQDTVVLSVHSPIFGA